jgi:hypothetical protein
MVLEAVILISLALPPVDPVEPPMVTAEGFEIDRFGRLVEPHPVFGVALDVGLPDGVGASALLMPVSWLRIGLGGLENGAGAGLRGGLTLVPAPAFFKYVRPTLSADIGYFFNGNATWIPTLAQNDVTKSLFSQVSYSFVDGHVGFEVGSKNFSVVLKGGLSWVDAKLGNPSLELAGTTVSAQGVHVRGVIPSARFGFMYCF